MPKSLSSHSHWSPQNSVEGEEVERIRKRKMMEKEQPRKQSLQ